MSHRNLTYLNRKRIVYRKYSSDDPTDSFDWGWYYADGTYGYYSLFNTKAKINSYKSLKWHLLTLWYLNPQLTMDEFKELSEYVCYEDNGFITFKVPEQILNNMIYEVYMEDLDQPPKNRLRKIVFKDGTGLSTSEKLSIVGSIIGKGKVIKHAQKSISFKGFLVVTIGNIMKLKVGCSHLDSLPVSEAPWQVS